MNKICVYAICKNESQFIEKWLDSMSEADYIVVLDTGSDDDTFEKLKNDSRVTRVEQKIFTPWRFDSARNASMELIPEDANILLCTDLDEILEPGWADVIRNSWVDGHHVRGYYKYAWSHNSKGEPGRVFVYDKLHDRNWHWMAPVHELLTPNRGYEHYNDDGFLGEHVINYFDKGVFLRHYPDKTKSRASYLPLLELRAEEDPSDYYGKYYLAHEYYYRGMYEKAIQTLNEIYSSDYYREKLTKLEIAAIFLFIGDSYRALGDNMKAIENYNISISIDNTYREPYLYIAEIYNELGFYHLAIGYVKEAENKSVRHFNWLERDDSWNEKPYDILSVAYFNVGEYEKGLFNVIIANEKEPFDERIKNNKNFYMELIK